MVRRVSAINGLHPPEESDSVVLEGYSTDLNSLLFFPAGKSKFDWRSVDICIDRRVRDEPCDWRPGWIEVKGNTWCTNFSVL